MYFVVYLYFSSSFSLAFPLSFVLPVLAQTPWSFEPFCGHRSIAFANVIPLNIEMATGVVQQHAFFSSFFFDACHLYQYQYQYHCHHSSRTVFQIVSNNRTNHSCEHEVLVLSGGLPVLSWQQWPFANAAGTSAKPFYPVAR